MTLRSRSPLRTIAASVLFATFAAATIYLPGCSGSNNGQPFAHCGNGVLNSGERCDDGNLDDEDACLSTCVPAVCGDAIVQRGVEQCDRTNLGRQSCASLGFEGGTLTCRSDCTFDTSACGARLTNTPTVVTITPSNTRTPTPTQVESCGNGLLESNETCESCPIDCQVTSCTSAGATFTVQIEFVSPAGQNVSTVTTLLGYRGSVVSLPGSGSDPEVRQRVRGTPSNSLVTVNDRGYALTLVVSRAAGVAAGQLAQVEFDTCAGAAAPALSDFSCQVEGCSGRFGPVAGCSCLVTTR